MEVCVVLDALKVEDLLEEGGLVFVAGQMAHFIFGPDFLQLLDDLVVVLYFDPPGLVIVIHSLVFASQVQANLVLLGLVSIAITSLSKVLLNFVLLV
jgi:hypothetical protein